jgi:hypothetical protein
MSPTSRTLTFLRRQGYLADVVERFIPDLQHKKDLFGVADVLAIHPRDRLVLLVQATTRAHLADRSKRIQARPESAQLLRAGVRVEIWGWGQRDGHWQVLRVPITLEALAGVLVMPTRKRREHQRTLFDF